MHSCFHKGHAMGHVVVAHENTPTAETVGRQCRADRHREVSLRSVEERFLWPEYRAGCQNGIGAAASAREAREGRPEPCELQEVLSSVRSEIVR